MPVTYCIACGGQQDGGTVLHIFPKDAERNAMWQRALFGQSHNVVELLPTWKVCSRHFVADDYFPNSNRLRNIAIPTLHPSNEFGPSASGGGMMHSTAIPTLMPSLPKEVSLTQEKDICEDRIIEIRTTPPANICIFCMTVLINKAQINIESTFTQEQTNLGEFIKTSILNAPDEQRLPSSVICINCLNSINELEGYLLRSKTLQTSLENQYIEHKKSRKRARFSDDGVEIEHSYTERLQDETTTDETFSMQFNDVYDDNDICKLGEGTPTTVNNGKPRRKRKPRTKKASNRLMVDRNRSSYFCEKCGKVCLSYAAFSLHWRQHLKRYRCEVCNKAFGLRDNLKQHMMIHTGVLPHQCETCGKKFRLRIGLKNHILAMHPPADVTSLFCCDTCGKTYTSAYGFKTHLKVHRDENKHRCDVCDKTFTLASTLRSHKLIHLGLQPFECNLCEKKFRTKVSLKNHQHSHSDRRDFQCHMCDKAFKTRTNLKAHVHMHLKPHVCVECGKSFAENFLLTKHRNNHECQQGKVSRKKSAIDCALCGKTCMNKFTYRLHMELAHQEKRSFQCDQCEKSFAMETHLNMHKRMHMQNKPFSCLVCGKGFAQEMNLLKHLAAQHSEGASLYDCRECGKKLSNSHSYQAHMDGHTRHNYQCSECSKTFVFKFNLTNHMKVHAPKDSETLL